VSGFKRLFTPISYEGGMLAKGGMPDNLHVIAPDLDMCQKVRRDLQKDGYRHMFVVIEKYNYPTDNIGHRRPCYDVTLYNGGLCTPVYSARTGLPVIIPTFGMTLEELNRTISCPN